MPDLLTTKIAELDASLKHSESDANADEIWPTGEVENKVNVTALRIAVAEIRALWATRLEAIQALGTMPEGYCFCAKDRIGDDSKHHEPECRDLRAVIAEREAA